MRQLYTFFRSSTSYRVRIALSVKGLEYEPHYVSLPNMEHRAAAYMAVNPQGLVPTLVDGGDTFAQSLAILEYLDERYPQPPLLPADPVERAHVRGLCQVIACDIHPLNNVRVLKFLQSRWSISDAGRQAWYAHWIGEGFRSLESTLEQAGRHGRFCFGDSVTMADICLVPQVPNARRFSCNLSTFPLSVAIADRAAATPEFKRAAPDMQGDFF